MLSTALEIIENELTGLRERTAREVTDINAHLAQMRVKTRLRPRIAQTKGYSAFSVCWRKIIYFDPKRPRTARVKNIRKGRGFKVPRARLLVHCRNCDIWESEFILEKEKGFAKVREKVHHLSKAILALKKYSREDS
jgi:hypothetical protein